MAGFMIENLARGLVEQFHWDEVDALPRDGSIVLLDVRTGVEYLRGHLAGSVNVPVDELRARLGELPQGKPIYVVCQSGHETGPPVTAGDGRAFSARTVRSIFSRR